MEGALAFFPTLTFVGEAIGLRLFFRHSSACSIAVAAICVLCVLLSMDHKATPTLPRRIAANLLCPLAALCWLAFLLRGMTLAVLVSMGICLICSVLLCGYCNAGRGKLWGMALGILIAIPLCLFSGLMLIFRDFGRDTVVRTVPSPDGRHYVPVIDSDQGALGGDTLVDVHAVPILDFGMFYMAQTPQRVLIDDWGAWNSMEISWLDEDTLVINGKQYSID